MKEEKTQGKVTSPEDDLFSEDNKAKSNWMRWNKVGDFIKGTLMAKTQKPARDDYSAQEVLELKVKVPYKMNEEMIEVGEGEYINVGFSVDKVYVINRIKRAKVGQIVGFRFESEQPSQKKGYAPAKSIEVYLGDMDSDYQTDVIKDAFGGEVVENEDTSGGSPLDNIEM